MIFISNDVTAFIRLQSLCSSTVILHVRADELRQRPLSSNSQVPLCLVLKSCIIALSWNTLVSAAWKMLLYSSS